MFIHGRNIGRLPISFLRLRYMFHARLFLRSYVPEEEESVAPTPFSCNGVGPSQGSRNVRTVLVGEQEVPDRSTPFFRLKKACSQEDNHCVRFYLLLQNEERDNYLTSYITRDLVCLRGCTYFCQELSLRPVTSTVRTNPTCLSPSTLSPNLQSLGPDCDSGAQFVLQDPEMASVKLEDCSQTLELNVIIKDEEEEEKIEPALTMRNRCPYLSLLFVPTTHCE
eukprot:XP_014003901.1 PREDICTED: uncharacterized protein LOC106573406 [Salmo salar]